MRVIRMGYIAIPITHVSCVKPRGEYHYGIKKVLGLDVGLKKSF